MDGVGVFIYYTLCDIEENEELLCIYGGDFDKE